MGLCRWTQVRCVVSNANSPLTFEQTGKASALVTTLEVLQIIAATRWFSFIPSSTSPFLAANALCTHVFTHLKRVRCYAHHLFPLSRHYA